MPNSEAREEHTCVGASFFLAWEGRTPQRLLFGVCVFVHVWSHFQIFVPVICVFVLAFVRCVCVCCLYVCLCVYVLCVLFVRVQAWSYVSGLGVVSEGTCAAGEPRVSRVSTLPPFPKAKPDSHHPLPKPLFLPCPAVKSQKSSASSISSQPAMLCSSCKSTVQGDPSNLYSIGGTKEYFHVECCKCVCCEIKISSGSKYVPSDEGPYLPACWTSKYGKK